MVFSAAVPLMLSSSVEVSGAVTLRQRAEYSSRQTQDEMAAQIMTDRLYAQLRQLDELSVKLSELVLLMQKDTHSDEALSSEDKSA